MIREADVVVIGGGVIGTSVAYYLARHGLEVALVEKGGIASGASGCNTGMVWLQTVRPGIEAELALASRRMFLGLSEELEMDIEYRQSGAGIILENKAQWEEAQALVLRQRQIGIKVRLLDREKALELEPGLGGSVLGITHSTIDGQVNPFLLAIGYARSARKLGAEILTRTAAIGIETKAGRVSGVVTPKGLIRAGVVVNAAGAHAAVVGRMVEIDVPVFPRKSQMMVTEAVAPLFKSSFLCGRYFQPISEEILLHATEPFDRAGIQLLLRQTANGNILLGETRENKGFDTDVTEEGMKLIARHVLNLAPKLAGVNVIRAFSAAVPQSKDTFPIIGPVSCLDGLFMAAGHCGDGILFAPITGRLIAESITTGKTSFPGGKLNLDRFGPPIPAWKGSIVG